MYPTIVPFTLTTVQVPNLALTHTKRNTVQCSVQGEVSGFVAVQLSGFVLPQVSGFVAAVVRMCQGDVSGAGRRP
jgi:hypothetical protein